MILSIATAVAFSLQAEAGVMLMANPIDDQYVLYHANNGGSYGVQMTSPVLGIAPRLDVGNVVLTAGWRSMGHQRIDSDVIASDDTYLNCRLGHGHCPAPQERWYTRMTTSEVYVTAGYKFHVGGFSIVPTVGFAQERAATYVQVTFPYEAINTFWHNYHAGHSDFWYGPKKDQLLEPVLGVDVERGHWGFGAYYQGTGKLGTTMGEPGQGFKAGIFRVTYRIGGK